MKQKNLVLVFVMAVFLALPFSLAASISDNLPVQIQATDEGLSPKSVFKEVLR